VNWIPSALRTGASLLLVALLVAACSGGGASARPPAPATVVDGAVTITADDLAFDATSLEATAGEAFTITFTNNDSVPHNLALYTEEGGEEIVVGDVINEGETVEIEVPALDEGTFYFVCDLHPEMNGPVEVTGATTG
jgi:plastocyanin